MRRTSENVAEADSLRCRAIQRELLLSPSVEVAGELGKIHPQLQGSLHCLSQNSLEEPHRRVRTRVLLPNTHKMDGCVVTQVSLSLISHYALWACEVSG